LVSRREQRSIRAVTKRRDLSLRTLKVDAALGLPESYSKAEDVIQLCYELPHRAFMTQTYSIELRVSLLP
jgi:hypothetical protein